MKFIGIDPGTSCGWAVLNEDGSRLASGVWDLSPKRHEGGGMRYVRCRRYMKDLLDTYVIQSKRGLLELQLVVVAYEEVRRHRGTTAAHVYGGIISNITALCEEMKIPYRGIPVATIKRTATSRGNAPKEAMCQKASEQWPAIDADLSSDEADALWCAETLRQELT